MPHPPFNLLRLLGIGHLYKNSISLVVVGAPPGMGTHLSFGKGFEYARTNNPTRAAFELAFAASERAAHGLAFASGMAATVTVLHLLQTGQHIVCIDDVYGGTQRYFRTVAKPTYGIDTDFVDMSDMSELRKAIRPDGSTKLIWLETPTNPT
jgi:cystathionine gamma-lyase